MRQNKFKVLKFSSQRIEAVPGTESCEFEGGDKVPAKDNVNLKIGKSHKFLCSPFIGQKVFAVENSKEMPSTKLSKKHKRDQMIDSPRQKRRKMDRSMSMQCTDLLKMLMKHPAGWVFNQPVDPVALKIPDYFSIITDPMDLGTIKSKLQKNAYLCIEEFAADVRLTFSNAMLYNPPSNNVHKMALELSEFFEVQWNPMEEKCNHERSKVGEGKLLSAEAKGIKESRQNRPLTPPVLNIPFSKRSKSSGGKVMEVPKPAKNCTDKLCGGGVCAVDVKRPLSSSARKCSKCGSFKCQCSIVGDSNHASFSSERPLSADGTSIADHLTCSADNSRQECQVKSTSISQMRKLDSDSKVTEIGFDDENAYLGPQLKSPVTDAASGEGLQTMHFDVQLSPNRALRNAMLRSRFAGAILRAHQKTHLNQDYDQAKMQLDKERLERRQRQEKAKIEAEIRAAKAAEAAARMKEDMELKMQREKEREAARFKLEKMENTASIEQNLKVYEELENLLGCPRIYHLPRLGLVLKDSYLEDGILDLVSHEEKARIKAETDAAAREKAAEMELKRQRQKAREAARLALENMKNTASIPQNLEAQKEFDKLVGCPRSYHWVPRW